MQPRDILESLRHAWHIVFLGLAAAACLSYLILTRAGPAYEVEASVVLLPGDSVIPEDSNPFLYLGGGTAVRDVLVRVVTSDEVSETILGDRPDATTYDVSPDPTTAGPMLVATASAPSAAEALTTLQEVLEEIPTALEELQASREVPPAARFTSIVLAQDQEATVNRSRLLRLLIGAVAACGVLTVFAASWFDGRRRSRLRKHRPGGAEPQQSESKL